MLDAKIPAGALPEKWSRRKNELKLVNPANKRKYRVIVVGSGLAGASAASSLAELGYSVSCFCFQDSPRRAHSIAAQGGINAAKNYRNDGDSVWRLFHDTIKGGRRVDTARDGEIVVALIDEAEATLKTFRREGQMIRLDPANRRYEAQRYRPDQITIQGRLAGLIRRY